MFKGLKQEFRSSLDYSFEKHFGEYVRDGDFVSYGNKVKAESMPVLFQGNNQLCVPCSVFFCAKWMDDNLNLDDFVSLVDGLEIEKDGIKPKKVLELARQKQLIKNYFYMEDANNQANIYKALRFSPVMIGVYDWWLVPKQGHAMVIIDAVPHDDDFGWLAVNWMNKERVDFVVLPKDTKFDFAVTFYDIDVLEKSNCYYGSDDLYVDKSFGIRQALKQNFQIVKDSFKRFLT